MYAKVAWVLVSSGTQVQPQVMLDPDYLPNYLSVSYDCLPPQGFMEYGKYDPKRLKNLFSKG